MLWGGIQNSPAANPESVASANSSHSQLRLRGGVAISGAIKTGHRVDSAAIVLTQFLARAREGQLTTARELS